MTEFSNDKNDGSEAAAAHSAPTIAPGAEAIRPPQPSNSPVTDEMALSAGAADWIEAVQLIEHRDWSAILRVGADGFDDIVGTIARFVQVDRSSSQDADVLQATPAADQHAPPARVGSTGMAWSTPSNMDALLAGVQVQSKMAAADISAPPATPRSGVTIGDGIASGRPETVSGQAPTKTAGPEMIGSDTISTPVVEIQPETPVVVETPSPVIATPVVETQPETPVVVETPSPVMVTPVVETQPETSVEVETPSPVIVTPVVETKPETLVEVETPSPVIVTPVVETQPETPTQVETSTPQPDVQAHSDVFSFQQGVGHVYVTDFDKGVDHIEVISDRFTSFDEMMSQCVAYQDEGSTVIEFENGTDFLVLTHFPITQLSTDMFTFEAPAMASPEMQMVHGTAGNDVFDLGAGDHIVDAGAGFDVITAGPGHDTFVFGVDSGHDFIVNFKPQDDHIQIDAALATDFGDLLHHAAIYQEGGSTQIEFSGGQLITLYNTNAANVGADWFVFA